MFIFIFSPPVVHQPLVTYQTVADPQQQVQQQQQQDHQQLIETHSVPVDAHPDVENIIASVQQDQSDGKEKLTFY